MVLTGDSWATYERLLDDLKDSSSPRLTFDRGTQRRILWLKGVREWARTLSGS